MGFYEDMADTAQELLAPDSAGGLGQGVVSLRRETTTAGASPLGPPTVTAIDTYIMSASVRGVSSIYVDGTVILASDLQIMMAVKGNHALTGANGTTAADGAEAAIEPTMSDEILIDGNVRVPKRILRVPGAGTRVASIVFVEG